MFCLQPVDKGRKIDKTGKNGYDKSKKGVVCLAYLDTEKYLDAVCLMIADGREDVPVPVRGVSMRPFLRNADFAHLSPLPGRIRGGDILLFQRPDGQYVLHRVYRCRKDGLFLMLGDAQLVREPVTREQLRAKVSFVRRGGQIVKPGDFAWWFFAYPWRWLAPWRRQISAVREAFRK